ncbi:hypothetical protein CCHR01_15768 [Colletotrichum chrysophilum]|uniref:Uncharacterized protein n=1 Tax=Colletotrichum chrysophilum TaxID=1836956 RepID=A0AAD9A5L8_9PEZI|nr:hypothetical protein CCHR01_15768 [Colletotrichum chrysophilum]
MLPSTPFPMTLRQPRSRTLERAESTQTTTRELTFSPMALSSHVKEDQGPQLPNASADTSLELWGATMVLWEALE